MSFQDPPRRQRPPRYPTLAQYAEGYPSAQDAQDTQATQATQGTQGTQGTQADRGGGNGYQNGYQGFAGLASARRQLPPWDNPWQQGASDTGPQRPVRNSGAHRLRTTGEQRPPRNTGGQQLTSLTEGGLPRRTSGSFRAIQDDDTSWPRDTRRGGRRDGGMLIGAVAGFLAAAVALGVANLVAAFVRPQASPIIAVGGAFIDRTPSALKNFAVAKFGENDKNMLLLGMYVTIAFIAIAVGVLAWRRVWAGVAGIGLFGLFGAFVAITRPDSHVTDVIPSIVGGIAGIVAILWLIRSGMPATRPAWARGR